MAAKAKRKVSAAAKSRFQKIVDEAKKQYNEASYTTTEKVKKHTISWQDALEIATKKYKAGKL